jgi:predicted small secreted protein
MLRAIESEPLTLQENTMRKSRLTVLMLALMMALGSVTLAGCENQGPAEEAGENIDETVEETGDAVEDASD